MPVFWSGGIWVQSTLSRVNIDVRVVRVDLERDGVGAATQQLRDVEAVLGVVALHAAGRRDLGAVDPHVGLADDPVDDEIGVPPRRRSGERGAVPPWHGEPLDGFRGRSSGCRSSVASDRRRTRAGTRRSAAMPRSRCPARRRRRDAPAANARWSTQRSRCASRRRQGQRSCVPASRIGQASTFRRSSARRSSRPSGARRSARRARGQVSPRRRPYSSARVRPASLSSWRLRNRPGRALGDGRTGSGPWRPSEAVSRHVPNPPGRWVGRTSRGAVWRDLMWCVRH